MARVVLPLAVLVFSNATQADSDRRQASALQKAGKIMPLEQIYAKARQLKPGKILKSEFDEKHGRYRYELELLDSAGRVWEMKLDAATGELIKLEQED